MARANVSALAGRAESPAFPFGNGAVHFLAVLDGSAHDPAFLGPLSNDAGCSRHYAAHIALRKRLGRRHILPEHGRVRLRRRCTAAGRLGGGSVWLEIPVAPGGTPVSDRSGSFHAVRGN